MFERQKEVEESGGIEQCLKDYNGHCPHSISSNFSSDITNIPDPSQLDSSRKNLLILDDLMLSPQNNVEHYFCRGRHSNVDCLYITQSYFRLPRHSIRENSNIFFIFPQDSKNLAHIYRDLCATDGIDYKTFQDFCTNVWSTRYNFVTVDLSKPCDLGKYRKNLCEYWSPKYDRLYSYMNSGTEEDPTSPV